MSLFDAIKDYIGPIIGALVGSGLNFHFDKSGATSRNADVNIENNTNITGSGNFVSNINHVDNSRRTVNHYSSSKGGDGNEGLAIIFIGLAGVIGSIYGYSMYAPMIFSYLVLALQSAAVFSICYGLTGGARGTQGWGVHGLYVAVSLLLLGASYSYCLPKLYGGYSPTYAQYAMHYGAFGYYKAINGPVRDWIISQIAGLCCLVAALAFSILFTVSKNRRQRIVAIAVAAALLFGSAFCAEGNIRAGL